MQKKRDGEDRRYPMGRDCSRPQLLKGKSEQCPFCENSCPAATGTRKPALQQRFRIAIGAVLGQVEEHTSGPVGENEAGIAALQNPQVDARQRILIGQDQRRRPVR